MSRYTINDLPQFSPWPGRLLGFQPWEQRSKTPAEVTREFEDEKWGPLLKRVKQTDGAVTIEDVDAWALEGVPDTLCLIGERLELLSALEARQQYLSLVESVLKSYAPAPALVELGAGYGSIILNLSRRDPFSNMSLKAGEYAPSGVELMEHLARVNGLEMEVALCDFSSSKLTDLGIPQNAMIFTSFATCSVPELPVGFVSAMSAFRPKMVIHIEPCYEHCDSRNLLGLMQRRYIEVNDYNANLVTLLHEQQERGLIRIFEERPAVFGANPLLAGSIIAWKPVD